MATVIVIPRPHYPAYIDMLVAAGVREADTTTGTETESTMTWTTDLSAQELVIANDVKGAVKMGIPLTLYRAVKPEIPTQQGYLGLSNPSAAQRLAWEKSTIRVLRALIRDA